MTPTLYFLLMDKTKNIATRAVEESWKRSECLALRAFAASRGAEKEDCAVVFHGLPDMNGDWNDGLHLPSRNARRSTICSLLTAVSRPTGMRLRSRLFISLMLLR